MPDVSPFRGVRYDVAQVGTLSDVVAPPYDVIDPALAGPALRGQPVQRHPPGAEPGGARRQRRRRPLRPRGPVSQGLAATRASSARTTTRPSTSTTRRSRSRARRTRARGSWRGCGSSRSARGRSIRTSRPWPARRPTGWRSTRRPGSTSARSSGSIPTPTARCSAPLEAGLRDRTPLVATDHLGVENRLWVVDRPGDAHRRQRPDGRQAGLHRRRPPPLRDRPEVSRRAGRERRSRPATTTRRTSA